MSLKDKIVKVFTEVISLGEKKRKQKEDPTPVISQTRLSRKPGRLNPKKKDR